MSSLRLPRLLSDGVVLQRRKSIHIWGWDEAGTVVTAKLDRDEASAATDDNGRFDIYLPARESGGPYELVVTDDKGGEVVVHDVLLGLVWLCSGQSNMELPMERCRDRYPEVMANDENDRIRTFKIIEETNYSGPLEEHHTGSWVAAGRDTLDDFSATAYFFAKNLQKLTGQAIGLINASLGGSLISGWMSREMLKGYDDLLAIADQYADENFYNGRVKRNLNIEEKWRDDLSAIDQGVKENWHQEDTDDSDWSSFALPGFFQDTELDGFIGAVWFRKEFDLPPELAGREARLFLGAMVDSDITYVNGQKVGETEYRYPPRKYNIPKGLTREKGNVVTVRLSVENGIGRFSPDKEYKIFNDAAEVDLCGNWKMKVGATCPQKEATDFVNWKPTGLYNAMTAPCRNVPVDGVIWYQGESNVELPYDYYDLIRRMIEGYRKDWADENLPFVAVQLPNFVIDQLPATDDWGKFRLVQNKILDIPLTGLTVTMGVGEDNDLHPDQKEPIGNRLALWAAHIKYGYIGEYRGPEIREVKLIKEDGKDYAQISLDHAAGLRVMDNGKGTELSDFYIIRKDGTREKVSAELTDDKLLVEVGAAAKGKKLQWCCENTFHGGLVVNGSELPLGPFEIVL